jgi:hypothetical protein
MTFEPILHHSTRRRPVDDDNTAAVDHWLDEALRTVPLPEGFLSRMTAFARETSLVLAGSDYFTSDFHAIDQRGRTAGPTSH